MPMKNQKDASSAFCYHSKETGFVSPVANALGPGSDMEKYIFAALVVPKSRLEPEFCTLLKASRNIWLWASSSAFLFSMCEYISKTCVCIKNIL